MSDVVIKNQAAKKKANRNTDKVVDGLMEKFDAAIKGKRMPTGDEVDAVINVMALDDESGKPYEDVVDNKRWHIEENLLPLIEVMIQEDSFVNAVKAINTFLYEEYLLEEVDADGASEITASKHDVNW